MNSRGLTLIEVIVGSLLFMIMALGITKVMRNNAILLYKSDSKTEAAALASELTATIKTLPFDSIFSYDSSNKHPGKPICCSGSFNPSNYLIDIVESPMKDSLLAFEKNLIKVGFDQFKIGITYIKRDSSDNTKLNSFVNDLCNWGGASGSGSTPNPSGGCDNVDPGLCFNDSNSDGDYWDFNYVSGVPETPNTGAKMLTVTILKNGQPMGVKTGTLLTRGNFSGEEISDNQAPLKLKINYPKPDIWVLPVTSANKNSLELETRNTYLKSRWDRDIGAVVRVDTNDSLTPTMNKRILPNGSSTSSPQITKLLGGGDNHVRFVGLTDSGAQGTLQVYDGYNNPSLPGGTFVPVEEKVFIPSGNNWSLWQNKFSILSGPSHLMVDGNHYLWSRKKSPSGYYSPFDVRRVRVDYGIPRITQANPPTYEFPSGGKTPFLNVLVNDAFKIGGGLSYGSGVVKEPVSGILRNVTDGGSYDHYFCKASGLDKNVNFSVSGSTTYLSLRDQNFFSPELIPEKEYSLTWEFGDYVGHKGSATYTFKVPDPVAYESTYGFNSAPVYAVNTSFTYSTPPIVRTPGGYTPVNLNRVYMFIPLYFYDLESGVNLKKFKMEVCKDGIPLEPIHLGDNTPNCETLFSYAQGIKSGGSAFGAYFYTSPLGQNHRPYITKNFQNTGPMFYSVGSRWRIRLYIENWAGIGVRTPDDYWRIEIVP